MNNRNVEPHKSSIGGLDANVMALLTYLGTVVLMFMWGVGYICWVLPLVLYFVEARSDFVRFHAMQAFVLFAFGAVVNFIVKIAAGGFLLSGAFNVFAIFGITGIIGLAAGAVGLAIFIYTILAMINAYKYVEYRIPFVNAIAGKIIAALDRR